MRFCKRLIAAITAFCLLLACPACGFFVQKGEADPNESWAVFQFRKEIEKYVDLGAYTEADGYGDGRWLTFTSEKYTQESDLKVILDGVSFFFPITYNALVSVGWQDKEALAETEIPPNSALVVEFLSPLANDASFTFVNATDQPMLVQDAAAWKLYLNCAYYDGDPIAEAVTFDIFGISNRSGLEKLLTAKGGPYFFDIYDDGKVNSPISCTVEFRNRETPTHTVEFEYLYECGIISDVTLKFLMPNTDIAY